MQLLCSGVGDPRPRHAMTRKRGARAPRSVMPSIETCGQVRSFAGIGAGASARVVDTFVRQ
jgi:hypothetical protein